MRALIRALFGLLCLALTLSGGTRATHGPAIAGYAELCRDGAAVVVAVDVSGAPVNPRAPPHCPDCLVPATLALAPGAAGPVRPARVRRAARPTPRCRSRRPGHPVRPPARAPPVPV